jgi:hypothetical protein
MTDSIEKEAFSFILNDLEPLRKEKYSFLKGFFVLNVIQKFYESLYGDTEMYIPETLCV